MEREFTLLFHTLPYFVSSDLSLLLACSLEQNLSRVDFGFLVEEGIGYCPNAGGLGLAMQSGEMNVCTAIQLVGCDEELRMTQVCSETK